MLEPNGRDLREQPLVQRRARLEALLKRAKSNVIRFSEAFPDPNALLAECVRLGLEGIVGKAEGPDLPIGHALGLDQGQNLGVARVEQVASEILRETFAEVVTVPLQRGKSSDHLRRQTHSRISFLRNAELL